MNPPDQSPASSNPTTNSAGAPPAAPPPAVATPGAATPGAWGGGLNAIKQAYAGIMANPVPAAIYIGVAFVVGILFSVSQAHAGTTVNVASASGLGLVSLIFIRALVLYSFSVADKKPLSVSQFFAVDVKQFIFLILAYIAVFIALLIAAIPIFIPWIWVVPWLAFTGYALVDKDLDPFAAMGESRRLASNHKGKFWGVVGWLILVSIAGAIVGAIPYVRFLVQPAIYVLEFSTIAILYRYLQKQPVQSAQPTTPTVAAV
jgi:hypothetical protein